MERFLVGESFSIAPNTTQTTALANDQPSFPMLPALPPLRPPPLLSPLLPLPLLPPHPPLLPLPPVMLSPRAQDISLRRNIHAPGHGALIGNAVAAEYESLPATTTTTTITITTTTTTTTATVIAAVASECWLQLTPKGSGYGGGIGPTSPYHHTPGYSAITFITTAAPIAVPATATDEGGPEDV